MFLKKISKIYIAELTNHIPCDVEFRAGSYHIPNGRAENWWVIEPEAVAEERMLEVVMFELSY